MPLVAFGVLRFLFRDTTSQIDILGAGQAEAPHESATVAARGKMVRAMLDSLGAGNLGDADIALMTLLFVAYSAVFGFLSDFVFGPRAFGRYLNGLICLLGGTLGLMAYARLIGKFDGNHFAAVVVIIVLCSTLLLFALAMVKSWFLGRADDFMSGAWQVKSFPKGSAGRTRSPSARDRLAAIAHRRPD